MQRPVSAGHAAHDAAVVAVFWKQVPLEAQEHGPLRSLGQSDGPEHAPQSPRASQKALVQ